MLVFEAVFPVVLVAALGFISRRLDWLSAVETDAIEKVSLWYLLPCLLFLGTASASFPAEMDWSFLWLFYLVVLAVYALGLLVGRVFFAYSLRQLSVYGMGGAYANVTVLGIPITLEVLGNAAFVPMLIVIAIHNLVLFGFGTVLAEFHTENHGSLPVKLLKTGRDVFLNPITGSLLSGALFNLLGFTLYVPLASALELLGRAAIPGALFGLGAALTRYHIRGELKPALAIVGTKLLIVPLVMWAVMVVAGFEGLWAKTAVLMSAMPTGISVYVFARRYQCCETIAATAIVLSSILGIATISAFAVLLTR